MAGKFVVGDGLFWRNDRCHSRSFEQRPLLVTTTATFAVARPGLASWSWDSCCGGFSAPDLVDPALCGCLSGNVLGKRGVGREKEGLRIKKSPLVGFIFPVALPARPL